MYELTVKSGFSAAHNLVDYAGACQRIHGHNWKVNLTIAALELNEMGMVIDLYELEQILNNTLVLFDHYIINEIPPFDEINPTSENLAEYIYNDVKDKFPDHIKVIKVELLETDNFSVTFRG